METVVSTQLGHRLKLLRQRLGITGAQMAEEADIPLPVIRKIEGGHTANPGLYVAENLTKRYGVNANWFVAGIGDMFDRSTNFEEELQQTKAELEEKDALIQMLQRAMVGLKKTRHGAHQPNGRLPLFGLFPGNWPR